MKGQNKSGVWFQLLKLTNGNYLVYKLCSNYDGQVKGGISKKWRCVAPVARMKHIAFQEMARNGLNKEAALKLYNKKVSI